MRYINGKQKGGEIVKYTGRERDGETKNRGKDWLFYTAGMGVLPILIKGAITVVYQKPFDFNDYCVEIFFITVVFLIDAIRNFSAVANWAGRGTTLVLVFSAAIYGAILVAEVAPVESATHIWNDALAIIISASLVLSLILDIVSMKTT